MPHCLSGTVTYGSGSPAKGARVTATVKGGGVTRAVYTDERGQYSLSWSGGSELQSVQVNGREVASNVWPGRHDLPAC